MRQLAAAGAAPAALARIKVVPWFVYVPGVAWIEHGHVYDEGCSFEFNLAPTDPKDGGLIYNVDYAATRYLAMAVPEIDPHGIEAWGFWGYMRYGWQVGAASFGRLWVAYARFALALARARGLHRSLRRRDARRRIHRDRLQQVAEHGGIPLDTASAIDHLARAPMTVSWRRLGRMPFLDKIGIFVGLGFSVLLALVILPLVWALVAAVVLAGGALWLHAWLGAHFVTSQLPMRAIPQRLR